jgi:hypothetical protein
MVTNFFTVGIRLADSLVHISPEVQKLPLPVHLKQSRPLVEPVLTMKGELFSIVNWLAEIAPTAEVHP